MKRKQAFALCGGGWETPAGRRTLRAAGVLLLAAAQLLGNPTDPPLPRGCTGSVTLGTFRITVRRPADTLPLPLKSVSTIPAGAHLVWDPVHVSSQVSEKGEVAVLVVPRGRTSVMPLEPRKLAGHTEWELPQVAGVLALVVGPHGLSMHKVKTLIARNEDLLTELADYAEQTSEVEALVQELASAEESGRGTDAALRGFSSTFGIAMPKLDSTTSSSQQASTLLHAVLPSANTYDPLAAPSAQVQQSVGLAASLAGMFFGNGVTLAAGGTALFANLKSAMFPGTEFRSAFAQTSANNALALCTKNSATKSRTRIAYLWAYRVPDVGPPVAAIAPSANIPLEAKSPVKLKVAEGSALKDLSRAHDWRLLPVAGTTVAKPTVTVGAADSLEIDLTKATAEPGEYRLAAGWDWDPLTLGTLWLQPYGDLSKVRLAEGATAKLVEGSGTVDIQLTGTDFEFLEKAEWKRVGDKSGKVTELHFALPKGKRAGRQETMNLDIDTAARGSYLLALTQSDGKTRDIPVAVLPPNPKIASLPLRLNVDEAKQTVRLAGTGLDLVKAITTGAGALTGAGSAQAWTGEIQLQAGVKAGQKFPLLVEVKGQEAPLTLSDAVEIVGPRPKIVAVRKSAPTSLGVDLRESELPAGVAVGMVLHLKNLAGRPKVELGCKGDGLRRALTLSPDEPAGSASLSFAGAGELYLSFDPGAVGYSGCTVSAVAIADPEGRSDAYKLGRVVRVPRLEQFTLSNEEAGPNAYAGVLLGSDLDLVEKAGWDASHGLPVEAIPSPVAGAPGRQTLRISVPWPAPAPHAPLYVWLRGETEGRKTSVAY